MGVLTWVTLRRAVNSVQFHPHGSIVVSGSEDRSIKLWDIRAPKLIQHYAAHSAGVNSVSLFPSGDFLLSGSSDTSLKVQYSCPSRSLASHFCSSAQLHRICVVSCSIVLLVAVRMAVLVHS